MEAAAFFAEMKQPKCSWDFGDSDDAWVTPFFAEERNAAQEWLQYFVDPVTSPTLQFWLGVRPSPRAETLSSKRPALKNRGSIDQNGRTPEWKFFPGSGYAILRSGDWFARWDLSPLGYLAMAPHGHLDALHVSVWFRDQPIIIDPGTGAYYADTELRAFLADWSAHNGPRPASSSPSFPERRGTFLWRNHHAIPTFHQVDSNTGKAQIILPDGTFERSLTALPEENSLLISDSIHSKRDLATTWKFPPSATLTELKPNEVSLTCGHLNLTLHLSGWQIASLYNPPAEVRNRVDYTRRHFSDVPLKSLCSPSFRSVQAGSFLELSASRTAATSDEVGGNNLQVRISNRPSQNPG
jgi:hypothetical protein